MEPVMSAIKTRRSIRAYQPEQIPQGEIMLILDAARWAPSGKNGQPWRFIVIQEDQQLKTRIANLTAYRKWVDQAPCLILVLLDKSLMYDRQKDTLAIGASIQNLLLAAHSHGLGTCWLGEILCHEDQIRQLLAIPEHLETLAVITLGFPASTQSPTRRRDILENIILR